MRRSAFHWWKSRVRNNITLAEWLKQARIDVSTFRPDETSSSLHAILEHRTGKSRAWLLANPQFPLEEPLLSSLDFDLQELKSGKPLAYILGTWDFYGLSFCVSQDVLIPRPETELLVETALQVLAEKKNACWIADVGTGSACIATAIAFLRPDIHVLACDLSFSALKVAQTNVQRYILEGRIHLLQCDLLNAVEVRFDLICANLPYIPSSALQKLPELRCEPAMALDGGEDGLQLFRKLLSQAKAHLADHGCILLEMQFDQADALRQEAGLHFPQAEIIIKRDLAGHDRLLIIRT